MEIKLPTYLVESLVLLPGDSTPVSIHTRFSVDRILPVLTALVLWMMWSKPILATICMMLGFFSLHDGRVGGIGATLFVPTY